MRPFRQKASFWRGGTSNGVMIAGDDLPEWRTIRERYPDLRQLDLKDCAGILQPLYRAIMGSPDPYGRQLNGMGGGLSSLSKAVIVDRSTDKDCDLDYLFIQIGSNCGNMSSAVAPFAIDRALLDVKEKLKRSRTDQQLTPGSGAERQYSTYPLTVRLRNLNTSRMIDADVRASSIQISADEDRYFYDSRGDYVLEGVSGYAAPITLSFLSPGGAKTGRAVPTGNVVDTLEYARGQTVRASLLDISNPGVFIDGRDLGLSQPSAPEQLNADQELMSKLELIRRAGAEKMGLDPETQSVPKVVMLFPSSSQDVKIRCQALSMQQAHRAVPMTLGLNLGVACKLHGTIAHELASGNAKDTVVIQHPTGKVEVGADIRHNGEVASAKVVRTARCLMEGWVNIIASDKTDPVA
ncbi:hypothetical protein LTR05_003054 [Lithohypha guttulata]|uniref:Uncharacterized protein n=1 Tax=Lithohypha guttulata TaxID=1690604 RepID=A0AAN7T513_9EURO|nr:hypothetical protein LTR05_003054 [Lithohypha guttulata]